jgi:hypothetical protein
MRVILGSVLVLLLAASSVEGGEAVPPAVSRLAADVATLTGPGMEGRAAGTPGGELAAQQIARWLAALSLRPGGVDGTFLQPVVLDEGSRTANVIGVLPGRDPSLGTEAVVIGAHYDHDGWVDGVVLPGADDNASGVALVLGLARTFAAAGGARRSLIFAFFGAEELGLLGSRRYVEAPTVPLERTVAMLNFDMVGRLRAGRLDVGGVDSGSGLLRLVSTAAWDLPLTIRYRAALDLPSDHARFHRAGVPVLFFFTGPHPDQHRASDTVDRLNIEGMAEISRLATTVVQRLADDPRPVFGRLGRRPLLLPLGAGLLLGWVAVSLVPAHREDSARDFAALGAGAWCGLIIGAASDIDRVLPLVAALQDRLVLAVVGIGATLPLVMWGAVTLGRVAGRWPWLVWITAGGLAGIAGRLLLEDRIMSRLTPDVDDAVLAAAPFGLAIGAVALGWWLNRPRRRQIG